MSSRIWAGMEVSCIQRKSSISLRVRPDNVKSCGYYLWLGKAAMFRLGVNGS